MSELTSKGVIDYVKLLKGIDAPTRLGFYKKLLKGDPEPVPNGQKVAGLEEQYMAALTDVRTAEDQAASFQTIVNGLEDAALSEQAQKDLQAIVYDLAGKQARMQTLAKELERIQEAVREISEAGVN